MKKVFFGTLLVLAFAWSATAQMEGMSRQAQEKIEAYKIAFFTEKLQLTPTESQAFWPLFNEFESKREDLKGKYDLKGKKIELLSDEEVRTYIMNQLKMDEELTSLRKDYIMQFMEVLPIRKVAMLQRVGNQFKRELLNEIQKRRQQNMQRRNRPGGGR